MASADGFLNDISAAADPGEAPGSPGAIGVARQIPRNTLALLMVGQTAVILPYLQQLSIWIVAVFKLACSVVMTFVALLISLLLARLQAVDY